MGENVGQTVSLPWLYLIASCRGGGERWDARLIIKSVGELRENCWGSWLYLIASRRGRENDGIHIPLLNQLGSPGKPSGTWLSKGS